jgi:hypothetical protein
LSIASLKLSIIHYPLSIINYQLLPPADCCPEMGFDFFR